MVESNYFLSSIHIYSQYIPNNVDALLSCSHTVWGSETEGIPRPVSIYDTYRLTAATQVLCMRERKVLYILHLNNRLPYNGGGNSSRDSPVCTPANGTQTVYHFKQRIKQERKKETVQYSHVMRTDAQLIKSHWLIKHEISKK